MVFITNIVCTFWVVLSQLRQVNLQIQDTFKIFNEAASKQMITEKNTKFYARVNYGLNRLPDLETQVCHYLINIKFLKVQFTYEYILTILYIEKYYQIIMIILIISKVFNYLQIFKYYQQMKKQICSKKNWLIIQQYNRQRTQNQIIKVAWYNENPPIRIYAILNQYNAKFGKSQ
ncbi:unnamed protein product [Paramecium sonneborni]|uniref:Transmembrane protein n=1 Tax=Paramecium sonneborni TaxID=65129 RepID=A0A8S1NV19_9CILI|nr:unnamed protein product [Paramecium sonneborni]CAD8093243.1 unnamed protein product [Paramecium sonneborni]